MRKHLLKKVLSVALSLTLIGSAAAILPAALPEITDAGITAQAASGVWSGKVDTSWYNSGKSVFYIKTPEQLAGLAKLVSDGNTMSGKSFELKADLVMNDTWNFANWGKNPPKNNWVPIGAKPNGKSVMDLVYGIKATKFEGSFNGNGHTITGLYCNHEMYGGLFAIVNGGSVLRTVMNNCYICADEPLQTDSSKLSFFKKYQKYDYFIPTAGGITAICQSGLISECEFRGKVFAIGRDDYTTSRSSLLFDACAGGIAGRYTTTKDGGVIVPFIMTVCPYGIGMAFDSLLYLDWLKSETKGNGIYNCINKGTVHAEYSKPVKVYGTSYYKDRAYCGGIVGVCDSVLDNFNAEISGCVNFGKLSTTYEPTAGIVGASSGIKLRDNYYSHANKACAAKLKTTGIFGDIVKYYDTKGHATRCADSVENKRIIASKFRNEFCFYKNDIRLASDIVRHNGSFALSSSTMTLGKGEIKKLNVYFFDPMIKDKSVKWRTSDSKVLKVDQSGNVKALGKGIAWITVKTSFGKEKSCKITVKSAPSKITLTKGVLTIGVGEKYSLGSNVNSGAGCATRTYRTSASSIVKMTKTNWTGEFVGVKPGVAYVTVRTYNGKEHSCKVTVKPAPKSVTISKKALTMKVGQTATLSCWTNDGSGCAKRTFRTSNSSIVKMTKTNWTGSFKAVKAGTAWVTVRTYNGKESSCKVTVTK